MTNFWRRQTGVVGAIVEVNMWVIMIAAALNVLAFTLEGIIWLVKR